MSYIEGSWIDIQKKKGLKANIFNASSFGYGDLLESLRNKKERSLVTQRTIKRKQLKYKSK